MIGPKIAIALLGLPVLVAADPAIAENRVNLLTNPGFERGMPDPWYAYHTGGITLRRGADAVHSGDFGIHFDWEPPPEGAYSAFCHPRVDVQPGTPYTVGVWARGQGRVSLWVVQWTRSGHFQGTSSGKTFAIKSEWKRFERTWTPEEGVYGAQLYLKVEAGTRADLDDITFSFDSAAHPLPHVETTEIEGKVKASDASFTLFVDGVQAPAPARIGCGEHVLAIRAKASGVRPRLTGSVRVADTEVPLDTRWRMAQVPADDGWMRPGFDDSAWKSSLVEADGIWASEGATQAVFRRVVLWKSERVPPVEKNQWLPMMLDRMVVPAGAVQSWVARIESPAAARCAEMSITIEVPAFLRVLDKSDHGTSAYSNYFPKKRSVEPFAIGDDRYNRIRLVYDIRPDLKPPSWAALYFQADANIPRSAKGYRFRFWREAGSAIDVPTTIPITVTGRINGRQCKYYHLTYNSPGIVHSGGHATFSLAERKAIAETLVACGMNVAGADEKYFGEKDVLDTYRYLQDRGVIFSCWSNLGMNWPTAHEVPLLKQHPERAGRLYSGDPARFRRAFGFDAPKRPMNFWSQEYLAEGGKVFYDSLRPIIEEGRRQLPAIRYLMWDWEYDTLPFSSFADRDLEAFRRFAGLPADTPLTDDIIVERHADAWKRFRLDQTTRHVRTMIRFLKDYGITLTVWRPGAGIDETDLQLSPLKDLYTYHFMGWPGAGLPTLGTGRNGGPSTVWRKTFPGIHLVGQSIIDLFPVEVIDERMFKIWAINMALGTAGGGWELWLDCTFPFPQTAGMSYYLGEATRLIASFEDTFRLARHVEKGFRQSGLDGRGSGMAVLEGPGGASFLVLLFNEKDAPVNVTVNAEGVSNWAVQQWEGATFASTSTAAVTVSVPARDVVALEYRRPTP